MDPEDMSGGVGRPMEVEQMHESWVGRDVVVLLNGDSEPLDGSLLEVNDRGVVIRFFQNLEELKAARDRGEEGGEPLYVLYFFPWRTVRTITLRVDEET